MPLIEPVVAAPAAASSTGRRKFAGPTDSTSAQRALTRRIADLERENYHENVKIEIPAAVSKAATKSTPAVRRILASKKALGNYFDDDEAGTKRFQAAAVQPSRYPARKLCSVCGYWGTIKCIRCGARYCSAACEDTHRETRCLKVYA
ncbi:uncharacterized protein V1510DRAFT_370133 [Dipodascopsis tothii]|uniref:uncharacterized protein n=1 Tax=Dipodascopsis tothii TaxID=44089 RepID=UPI0034CD94D4